MPHLSQGTQWSAHFSAQTLCWQILLWGRGRTVAHKWSLLALMWHLYKETSMLTQSVPAAGSPTFKLFSRDQLRHDDVRLSFGIGCLIDRSHSIATNMKAQGLQWWAHACSCCKRLGSQC